LRVIEVEGVAVVYPNGVEALSDVSLKVERGEFVFIVGPTGVGKTTLLRLIYRDLLPTRGRVKVMGRDTREIGPGELPLFRRRIGIVFQDFGLLPQRTVWENLAFVLRAIGAGRREVFRKVPKALEMVGLLDKAHALPNELSVGEQQRVCIARAIVNEPPLLVADEPTGNLDPKTSWGIMELLQRINEGGTTVVVASHDKLMVDRMRRRVIELFRGRVVRDEREGAYEGVAV